jgi:hypothetical protein
MTLLLYFRKASFKSAPKCQIFNGNSTDNLVILAKGNTSACACYSSFSDDVWALRDELLTIWYHIRQ